MYFQQEKFKLSVVDSGNQLINIKQPWILHTVRDKIDSAKTILEILVKRGNFCFTNCWTTNLQIVVHTQNPA